MGSIIAILGRSIPVDISQGEQMLAAAPHRGSNFTFRLCGSCLLGVSNNSEVIDSSISSEGQLTAAFSGRLDNAVELSRILANSSHPPASPDAADVVVSAFNAFGADAPREMRGMFACVVTDGHQMWCFRDHFGFKSLFYRDDLRGFFAATEAKQIIAGAKMRREPDLKVIEQIFYGMMPADMPSALKGVRRLPQATTLTVNNKGVGVPRSYWHPADLLETARLHPAELSDRFSEVFRQAVARTVTGDDVISLSGGIDSPTVAAFAAPHHMDRTGRPIAALTAVFPHLPAVDESSYVKLIAEYLDIKLHTYTIKARALDDVTEWCKLLDGPCPVLSIPEVYDAYALARRFGYRNMLTGDMAEFVFNFRDHLIGHLLTHGRWTALLRLLSTERRRGTSWRVIGRELIVPFVPGQLAELYFRRQRVNRYRRLPAWIELRKANELPARPDLLIPTRRRWSDEQLLAFDGSTIVWEADELCAAVSGVTVRRPFADVDLCEFFVSLPAEIKFPDRASKTLIRRLLRGKLPDKILDRRDKTAFDDHVMSQIDYPLLERFLLNPSHSIEGVNYRVLAERIKRREFDLVDWFWAKDLTRVHAFLGSC